MEWLDAQHPEYVDRLADLVAARADRDHRRAVLRADPDDDPAARPRRADHAATPTGCERRLGAKVRGMWMPERVWEQSLASDLAAAGIEYTVLDDFHFKNAGLDRRAASRLLPHRGRRPRCSRSFPAASGCATRFPSRTRRRRSTTCAASPSSGPARSSSSATTARSSAPGPRRRSTSTTTAGCGSSSTPWWPTRDWLTLTTLAEATLNVPPPGKVYLPDGSYREMTEWALPAEQLSANTSTCGTTWSTTRAGRSSSGSSAAASGGTSR